MASDCTLEVGTTLISDEVAAAAVFLRQWATASAMPFWASAGFDGSHDRFEERLTLEGWRLPEVPIRLMTQARQIYVYSLAFQRGWSVGADALLERAFSAMIRDFRHRDGCGGWVYSIWRDGSVADARRDLYSHAFVLLAIASYVAATGRQEVLQLADETLAFLDVHMAAPRSGGFVDAFPPVDSIRRQNPHMHMFEALLSLSECSGNVSYAGRAGELFGLFASRFFLPQYGVLGEYFDIYLRQLVPEAETIVEPGHHYEWIWLLRRFERVTGRSVEAFVEPLYVHADRHGYDRDGLVVDELFADGRVRTASRRTWPVTEAIKANVVEAAHGRLGAAAKAVKLATRSLPRFLTTTPAGGWFDRLDAAGQPSTDFMPASTLYHIVCAINELDGLAAEQTAQSGV